MFSITTGDIYWCTADVGWVTGHSYLLYGPLACGAITLMFEGVPNYPGVNRLGQVIDKHQVNILYTAPTAIRALMAEGDKAIEGTKRDSLRIMGSVGEPINPEAWEWYYNKIGNSKCPIVDTWWQTETGGFMITPLPGATELKAGSATRPFFGVQPAIVDNLGNPLEGLAEGNLVITDSWRVRPEPCLAIMIVSNKPTSPPLKACISAVMALAVTKMATTGSPAELMTC